MNPLRHPLVRDLIPEIVGRMKAGDTFQDAKHETITHRRRKVFAQLHPKEGKYVLKALDEKAKLLFTPIR